MNKYDLIKEAMDIECPNAELIIKSYTTKNSSVTLDNFIILLSKVKYNLAKELHINATITNKLLKELFPNRPVDNCKVCVWLLGKHGLKQCGRCNEVYWFDNFRPNKSLKFGINTYCKDCHMSTTKETQNARQSKYRATLLQRTPIWSDLEAIAEFFDKCPEGYHVDHIIPLQGKLVSGLHVLNNLQYLPATENLKKSNKYIVE